MNAVHNNSLHPWSRDLAASRDLNDAEKAGFRFVLAWFEQWRGGANLPPSAETARRFWREQITAKPRQDWQLDQWAQAFRWFLQNESRPDQSMYLPTASVGL